MQRKGRKPVSDERLLGLLTLRAFRAAGMFQRLPENERQHMVARALVDVQMEVIGRHGFAGDAAYAQAQVALMDHAHDAVVTASVAAATTNLYARAGINLQAALTKVRQTSP